MAYTTITEQQGKLLKNYRSAFNKVGLDVLLDTALTRSNVPQADTVGAVAIKTDAVTTVKVLNANVTLPKLASGIAPTYVVKYAGKVTTTNVNPIVTTVTGVLATDVVLTTLQAKGATPRVIVDNVPTLNTITTNFSGLPSTDHVFSYVVLRPVA